MWSGLVDQVAFVDYNPWENFLFTINLLIMIVKIPCSDLWRRMFIWWDGKTNPCDVDYKSHLSVGNLSRNNLRELWNSEKYKILRKSHLEKGRATIRPCSSCTVV